MDEDALYYKFELKNVVDQINGGRSIFLRINEVTQIFRSQQKHSDKMYQDAIEANYSHEQMTPLNCIINNSKLIETELGEDKEKNKNTLGLVEAIKHSGLIFKYYNQNQIQRMKIKKNEFYINKRLLKSPEHVIMKILKPFSLTLKKR